MVPVVRVRSCKLTRPQSVALACITAGVLGEALFHRAPLGLNFSLFIALAASIHAAFTPGAVGRARRAAAVALPVLASAPVFLYDSQWARFFAIPMACAWLLVVPRLIEHGFALSVFGRVPERVAEAVMRLVPALDRSAKLPFDTLSERSGAIRTILLGLAVGIPSALVFALLFSFDPKFVRVLLAAGHRSDDLLAFGASALGLSFLLL